MSSHDGSVQVAFENKSFQVAKKANPGLGEGFIPQCARRVEDGDGDEGATSERKEGKEDEPNRQKGR